MRNNRDMVLKTRIMSEFSWELRKQAYDFGPSRISDAGYALKCALDSVFAEGHKLVLPCPLGKIVAEVVRDDDEYKEIEIDLVREGLDGDEELMQLCVAGTDKDGLHVHVWDGGENAIAYEPKLDEAAWY